MKKEGDKRRHEYNYKEKTKLLKNIEEWNKARTGTRDIVHTMEEIIKLNDEKNGTEYVDDN